MTRALRLAFAPSTATLVAALALATPPPLHAQDGGGARREMSMPLETALSADTVTVGDRFRAVVTAWFPPGSWLELEAPADSDAVQLVAPPKTAVVDSAGGRMRIELEMVAWRTGLPDSMAVHGRVVDADGMSRRISSTLRLPFVRSVLPADTARHVPRGPKDVWGPSRAWGIIALLAALVLLVLALIAWLVLRRRRRKEEAEMHRTPRERALAALDEARASGLAEAGEWKAFYSKVSAALRRYAMTVNTRWSTDLTTAELLDSMRMDRVSEDRLAPLAHVLRVADLAKFARGRRTLDDAWRDWETARRWVETFDRTRAEPASEPEMAGAGAEEAR